MLFTTFFYWEHAYYFLYAYLSTVLHSFVLDRFLNMNHRENANHLNNNYNLWFCKVKCRNIYGIIGIWLSKYYNLKHSMQIIQCILYTVRFDSRKLRICNLSTYIIDRGLNEIIYLSWYRFKHIILIQ